MQVNCLGCGHLINLGNDYDNFKGPVRCNICRTMTNIETESGKVKSVQSTDEALFKPHKVEKQK